MNTLPNMYKLFHFNLTTSPLYVVKLKITQKQPTAYAVRSVEIIVPDFYRKSFNVHFFPSLFEHSFSSLPTKKSFTFSLVLSKNYLETQYVQF